MNIVQLINIQIVHKYYRSICICSSHQNISLTFLETKIEDFSQKTRSYKYLFYEKPTTV